MRLIGIFIAIALAATVGFFVLKFAGKDSAQDDSKVNVVVNPQAPQTDVSTVEVLVAKEEIPIGTIIKPELLDRQPWPANLVLQQFVVSDKDASIIDMVARSSFQAREPIIMTKLANPNDPSFLGAALPEGKRATTIAADAVTGVGGFIFPGDRVDVLFTHELPKAPGSERTPVPQRAKRATEVLLTNIKVLAVDLRSSSNAAEGPKVPTNVSLEVTPRDAERLRLAERNGFLSLTLRSLKDKDNEDVPPPVMEADLSVIAPEVSPEDVKMGITVVRGTKVETNEVGGEEYGKAGR